MTTKDEIISIVTEMWDTLNSSLKSVACMAKTLEEGDLAFTKQVEQTEALKKSLDATRRILPKELFDEAMQIATDYIQTPFNWVLHKIKADIQLGKQSYNQNDLIELHEILINELIPLDEVQAQMNAFADKLKKYLNDL